MPGTVRDSVRGVSMFPQRARPCSRERVVDAAGRLRGRPQAPQIRSMERNHPNPSPTLDGGDRPGGQIVERQNPDRWITEKRLREAYVDGGSEIAQPETSQGVVEAINGRTTRCRSEPQRTFAAHMNARPAGSHAHPAHRQPIWQLQPGLHYIVAPMRPVRRMTPLPPALFRHPQLGVLPEWSCRPDPGPAPAARRVVSKGSVHGMPGAPSPGPESRLWM